MPTDQPSSNRPSNEPPVRDVVRRHWRSIVALFALLSISFGSLGFAAFIAYEHARCNALERSCTALLGMLGNNLPSYYHLNKSLPPLAITADDGTPLLSWRVPLSEYIYYHVDFQERMDYAEPWDEPRNAAFFDGRALNYRCPAVRDTLEGPNTTSYVAVIGRGTPWTENDWEGPLPRDAERPDDRRPARLLVTEWPCSDIHWAEPRDVSVAEFLDYFSGQPPCQPNHRDFLFYLDTDLEVRRLPLDTPMDEVRRIVTGE